MRAYLSAARIVFLVVLLGACSGQQSRPLTVSTNPTAGEQTLFSDVADPGIATIPDEPTIVRGRLVTINLDLLLKEDGSPKDLGKGLTLILNLFEDVQLVATLDHIEPNSIGGYTWTGRIEGVEYSQVTLVYNEGLLMGNITLPKTFYQVRPISEGRHAVLEIDQAAFPAELEPIPVETPP